MKDRLQIAIKNTRGKVLDSDVPLVRAWLDDVVSLDGLLVAMGKKNTGSGYFYIAKTLRQLYREKKIIFVE